MAQECASDASYMISGLSHEVFVELTKSFIRSPFQEHGDLFVNGRFSLEIKSVDGEWTYCDIVYRDGIYKKRHPELRSSHTRSNVWAQIVATIFDESIRDPIGFLLHDHTAADCGYICQWLSGLSDEEFGAAYMKALGSYSYNLFYTWGLQNRGRQIALNYEAALELI